MAQSAPQAGQSESMEDILQSIKRIIEDDTGPQPAPAAGVEVDVLDLTQVVKTDGTTQELPATPPAPMTPEKIKQEISGTQPTDDVMKSIDAIFAEKPAAEAKQMSEEPMLKADDVPATPKVAASATPQSRKPIAMEDGLVSDQAAQAAAAALKPIVDGGQKDYSIPRITSPELRNGNTVEDLLLEALRPLLKSWLDEHLPTIVQKIVEKEVKRIVTFHQD